MTDLDLAEVVAGFAAALHAAGLPVGPDRAERFARAVVLARPQTLPRLRACARATLSGSREQISLVDAVVDAVFGGMLDPADFRGDAPEQAVRDHSSSHAVDAGRNAPANHMAGAMITTSGESERASPDSYPVPSAASAADRLRHRHFADLSPQELADLAAAMAALRLATPPRRTRRTASAPAGTAIDLRKTLRRAYRTGGDPLRLVRRTPKQRPRRLVALCDISGSMEPYARALLQLLYCATHAARTEVFTFATRLTRLTPVLAGARPGPALARAGQTAPDWSGGTRIGAAVQEFLDRYGRRGMARGAVVLIISDGWETGDAAELGAAMRRLSLLAYRIVWVNPRARSPRFRPVTAGMAAAWPHCDAVVSAHDLAAVDDLRRALADPVRQRGRLAS
jgi:uncharacterized protein with von Willebrand factor type A (vWA) domain